METLSYSFPCLKAIISLLLFEVRAGGKNLSIKASTNSSQLSIDPYGIDSNQLAATSLNEKENNYNLIIFRLTPFSLIVFTFLINLPRCLLGFSLGCPVN